MATFRSDASCNRKAALLSTAALLLCQGALAGHPCATEVASACADRPGTEIGACLKDPEEHDYPTEISSACTDFIALNKACADDIESFCDAGHFTDDTVLCLTKWTPQDNLSPKCQGVLEWAVPKTEEDAADEVVTDELGMSEADHAEKKEWQKKRAAARGEAIARMKMKDTDRKKEEDRVALEEFKKTDPEGYAAMMQQQEEEKRQQAEFKKKERARAAAIERAKKKAAGEEEEDDDAKSGNSDATQKKGKSAKSQRSWLYSAISFVVIGIVGVILYNLILHVSGPKGGGSRKVKKKRG